MEAPVVINDSNPLNIDTFNLNYKDKEYKLTICRTSVSLKLTLNQIEYPFIFESNFTFEELLKLSNIFGIFNSLEEIQKSLKNTIDAKKFELINTQNNQINIGLKVNIFEKRIDISIPLIQREFNQKEINGKLLKENFKLKKEINNLKEENKNIKLTLNEIQNRLNELGQFKNNSSNNNITITSSTIATTSEQNNLIINRLKSVEQFLNLKNFQFTLLYRGTRDGDDSQTFHRLCDNYRNILVLVETTKNRKFGGFCSIGYKSEGDGKKDNSAFIFSLDKLKIYNVIKGEQAVFWGSEYGPLFAGGMTVVSNKFFTNKSYSNSKNNYYQLQEDYELNGGEFTYLIKEVEVYKIN